MPRSTSPVLRSLLLRSFSMSGFNGLCAFRQPFAINLRRNLGRFDLAAAAPKNIGVGNGNGARRKMPIDRRLMLEQALLFLAVRDRHDVHVFEFGAGLAPITMGQNVMAADFTAGFNFASGRDRPMKQRVKARDADSGLRRLYVLEKR